MRDIKAQIAYLRGLVEGSEIAQSEKQKLVWEGLIGFCEGVAESVSDLKNSYDEYGEYIEAIDEDLSSLEKYFYESETDEETEVLFSRDVKDDNSVIEMTCPNCREELSFQDSAEDYEVICPQCGKVVWTHYTELEDSQGDHTEPEDLN